MNVNKLQRIDAVTTIDKRLGHCRNHYAKVEAFTQSVAQAIFCAGENEAYR